MTFELPRSGQFLLSEIPAALAGLAMEGGWPQWAELRVVAYHSPNGDWSLFCGQLRLRKTDQLATPDIVRAGSIALVSSKLRLQDLFSEQGLRQALQSWKVPIDPSATRWGFQKHASIDREDQYRKAFSIPHWQWTVNEDAGPGAPPLTPNGPFIDSDTSFFAPSIGDAAAQWLDSPTLANSSGARRVITIYLPDERAYFTKGTVNKSRVTLAVSSRLKDPLFVGMLVDNTGVRLGRLFAPVTGGVATLRLPGPVTSLTAYLMSADGVCLDQLSDTTLGPGPSIGLLLPPRTPGLVALMEAIDQGEGQHVEFKEWLPLEQTRAKSKELLRTVCAFANTAGGKLFVGVADDLTISGTDRELAKMKSQAITDLAAARREYLKLVRRSIGEGIAPPVSTTISWVTVGTAHVLSIEVQGTNSPSHYIVSTREAYVRRGGNSVKAVPEQLLSQGPFMRKGP